ncbi:MAG TPA: TonB-dependent receptor [Verrucomicrobiae bacterium]|nr:TonB-dependent receptor [Verrucomicrobiae bacterium]
MTVVSQMPSPRTVRFAVAALFALIVAPVQSQEPVETEAVPAAEAPIDATEAQAQPAPVAAETIPVRPTEPQATLPTDGEATQLDAVEVTGSRIRRTDYETAQPVAVVTREDIERTGLTNLGDILQRIPAAGSALNRNFNNGGNGQTEIDLRNLGSTRVLVLVNGHRWVSGTSLADSAVDLNTIPVSIIERVEVLKDGASAVYGSDAITGVVNVITRKDFQGFGSKSQAQAFDDGKGMSLAQSFSFGNIGDKTSMFIDFNFVRQEELYAGDRPQSAVPQVGTGIITSGRNFTNEFVHTRGSAIGPEGYFIFVPSPSTEAALNATSTGPGSAGEKCPVLVPPQGLSPVPIPGLPEDAAGVRICLISPIRGEVINAATAGGTDTLGTAAEKFRYNGSIFGEPDPYQYNFAPVNYLLTPFEQDSVFSQINHQFLPWLNFSSQILNVISRSDQALAEEPLRVGDLFGAPPFSQAYIAADQIYNPLGQDIGRGDPGSELVGLGGVVRRIIEAGPRVANRENNTLFIRSQFDGDFEQLSRLFGYDAGYSYGKTKRIVDLYGSFNMERVAAALGPSTNCPSLSNPNCVPLNLFGPVGSITQEMLDYVTYVANETNTSTVQDLYANMSTEFDELTGLLPYNLMSRPIGMAIGVEHRVDTFDEIPDPFTTLGISSGLNGRATKGRQNVTEGYMELAVPIVEDIFLADELDLSLAARYTQYNTFDPKWTGKAGLRWKPIEDLLVRGTLSQSFRAPNLQELFLGQTDSFPSVDDPCAQTDELGNAQPRTSGTDTDANCDAEGVPDEPATSSQTYTVFEGSRDLKPEIADTFTTGFVWSPAFIRDFNVYVDYWNIDLQDFIAFVGPAQILELCYERPAGSPRPAVCDKVQRDESTGQLTRISASPVNFARLVTNGVDIAFDYVLPIADWYKPADTWGQFKVAFDSQYLNKYDQTTPTSSGAGETTGFAGRDAGDQPLPRLKGNSTLSWSLEQWSASWSMRYLRGTTEDCNDGGAPSLASLGQCSNPDTNLADGTDDSTNTYDDVVYNNIQVGYNFTSINTGLTFGVLNALDQDPPTSGSAFANSAPATLYETWGSRQLYLKLDMTF